MGLELPSHHLYCGMRMLPYFWTTLFAGAMMTLCSVEIYWHNLRARLTHWKRLWCWEGLGAGGEGDDRGWDGWMASRTQWTWVWVNSGSWWRTGRPAQFMGLQRVRHNWATELNWTERDLTKFRADQAMLGCKELWHYFRVCTPNFRGYGKVGSQVLHKMALGAIVSGRILG